MYRFDVIRDNIDNIDIDDLNIPDDVGDDEVFINGVRNFLSSYILKRLYNRFRNLGIPVNVISTYFPEIWFIPRILQQVFPEQNIPFTLQEIQQLPRIQLVNINGNAAQQIILATQNGNEEELVHAITLLMGEDFDPVQFLMSYIPANGGNLPEEDEDASIHLIGNDRIPFFFDVAINPGDDNPLINANTGAGISNNTSYSAKKKKKNLSSSTMKRAQREHMGCI